jgi:hypothetical protein
MVNVHGMARLGVLAVGLGIGAAWAHTPVASADSSSDWLSSIDSLLSGASPASATPIDLDISFDGYTIYDGGGSATAVTTSGEYGLAIAYGDDAYAQAVGGTGDYALADGTNAFAAAGGDIGDTGADGDTAIDIGSNAGMGDGAWAGNSDLVGGDDGGTGAHDTAIDIGNNTGSGDDGGSDGAFAGAGGLAGGMGSGDGNNDTAIDIGNNSGAEDASYSVDGNGNYASESGGATDSSAYAVAGRGDDNIAIGTSDNAQLYAYDGNDNYAYVDGPAGSYASAGVGDSDIAYVNDPFGAAGSLDSAIAGNGFSNDLAEVLLAHGNTTAFTADLLYDIVSLFGNASGSF